LINACVQQVKKLDAQVRDIYSPNGEISPEILTLVEKFINHYNILLSKLTKEILTSSGEKLKGNNLPSKLQELQCAFIESFAILLYSINEIKKKKGSTFAGTDGICFTTFDAEEKSLIQKRISKTRFGKSSKRLSIRKNLPKNVPLTELEVSELRDKVDQHNRNIFSFLIDNCNVKNIQKNYKGTIVKRV